MAFMHDQTSNSLLTDVLVFGASLSFCALTAFLETTITTLRLFKLRELAQSTDRYQMLFDSLETNHNRVLTTILIAKNLVDVTAATFGAKLMGRLLSPLPDTIALWVGIAVVTVLILMFGEIIPKIVAKAYGERFFSSTLGITNLIYYLLYPLVNSFVLFAHGIVHKLFGKNHETGDYVTSEKEIRFLIDYVTQKGLMEGEKTVMIKSIFELGTTPVREIMVPENMIVSLDVRVSPAEALDLFLSRQYSRLPVYSGSPDNIIGMLHLKDLCGLFAQKQADKAIKDIVRTILFIPESIKVNQLLKEFKHQHMHIAMVINEYGSIIGLVTLEDVLEEIVGEIRDEYESVPQKVINLKPNTWLVDASIELKDLTPFLDLVFETERAQTLGGFLNERFQHLPKKGERLVYKNFCFQIQQAGSKRVLQALVIRETPVEPMTDAF